MLNAPAAITPCGVELVERFNEQVEIAHLHVSEAFVFKAEIKQALARRATCMAVSKNLPQQAGLAGSSHANHRRSLRLDGG